MEFKDVVFWIVVVCIWIAWKVTDGEMYDKVVNSVVSIASVGGFLTAGYLLVKAVKWAWNN